MALIAMCIYDTGANQRAPLVKRTLDSLLKTVDFNRHRIVLVVNASTDESAAHIGDFLKQAGKNADVIWLPENVGTARGINRAWLTRQEGEHAVKMDDDVVIHSPGWVDEMEEAISRDSRIGIIGLKRKDLLETVDAEDQRFRSVLKRLPHQAGQRWIDIEIVEHVMGTCQMFNAALLEKIGYFYQPRLYGFDDSLAAVRCRVAGFYNCFLPHYEIDHIDDGQTPYQEWKGREAWQDMAEYNRLKDGYLNGSIPIWYGPNGEQDAPPVQAEAGRYGWTIPNLSTR